MQVPRVPPSKAKVYAIIAWVGTGVFGVVVVLNIALIVAAAIGTT
ncbi:MAG: hypothetical protein O3B65_02930 [Chloroflexi bacterium]|nr:hypothetical protein [Chloroflexota bacterium]